MKFAHVYAITGRMFSVGSRPRVVGVSYTYVYISYIFALGGTLLNVCSGAHFDIITLQILFRFNCVFVRNPLFTNKL